MPNLKVTTRKRAERKESYTTENFVITGDLVLITFLCNCVKMLRCPRGTVVFDQKNYFLGLKLAVLVATVGIF